jgi:hypothetical protein
MEPTNTTPNSTEIPQIAAFVQVTDADRHLLPVALHDLSHQRDVQLDIIVLDRTTEGGLAEGDHIVVRLGPDASCGDAHRAGLNHTRAVFIAWHVLGVRNLPTRIHIQWQQLSSDARISMVTSNLVLTDEAGRIVALANPDQARDAPTPMWQGSVLVRRAALARIGRSADLPVELFLLMRLRSHKAVAHVAEPLCVAQESVFSAQRRQSLTDALAIKRVIPPIAPRPEITVIVTVSGPPIGIRRLLASLAVQELDTSRFEVCIIDAGADPILSEVLAGVELPYRLRMFEVGICGPAEARNIAIQAARGELLVFFDASTQPASDNLRRHLARHRKGTIPRSVVGPIALTGNSPDTSFTLLAETTNVASLRPEMRPGETYRGQAFSSSNLSIPRASLLRIGGFDTAFSGQGAEDVEIGLRLERALGMSVIFDPDIRATRSVPVDLQEIIDRQRALGWCTHRMARKHDDPTILFGGQNPLPLDQFWTVVKDEVQNSGDEAERLMARVLTLCDHERAHDEGPRYVEEVRPLLERICALEFGRGLLGARAGLPIEAVVRQI